MEKKEVATVKSEHVMKLMSKLWEYVPDETKRELIDNDDITVQAIKFLEKHLEIEGTILTVPEIENETDEDEPEEEGESNDD